MAQKKIINEIAFPEKPLQADIRCSELEKKFPESPEPFRSGVQRGFNSAKYKINTEKNRNL